MTATRCPSASRAGSAVPTCSSASPNGPSSGAAPNSHAVATLTHSPGQRLVIALTIAGCHEEAVAATKGLIDAAEATRNPCALSFALLAYGTAFLDADPDRALEAMRRGLVIAQDSGNRFNETHLAAQYGPTRGPTRRSAGRARLLHAGDPQLPRLGQHHHDPCPARYPRRSFRPARTIRGGGHHRRVRHSVLSLQLAFPN